MIYNFGLRANFKERNSILASAINLHIGQRRRGGGRERKGGRGPIERGEQ